MTPPGTDSGEGARSRLAGRMRVLPRALAHRFLSPRRRQRPVAPRRILIAHHLLAGDTLMLTPLLAKLREQYPQAEVTMVVRRSLLPLYSGRPYGVHAVAYGPRESVSLDGVLYGQGFDLALVPGDNRYSWLAAAAGASWIVAFSGDRPAAKSWPVDELRPYREQPAAWGDMVADLVDGAPPHAYDPGAWPAPACAPFDIPAGRYAVLHVEASTPLKHWRDADWLALAGRLAGSGVQPVWSAGPAGATMVRRIDAARRYPALGHLLDLAQLWRLIAGAALLVSPDTSAMHLGRLTATPSVALFGPSSATLFGPGEFWRAMPCRAVTVADFPCRDQNRLFKREIAWVRRCQRTSAECSEPRCMHAIGVEEVARAASEMLR